MFFPFDNNLVGYQEVVSLKTSDLPIPIFTFPKGSFFVDGTYAKIKGTNKILRPGIDYLVLSCNETIPFSADALQNEKLKQAYVRNAILLRTKEVLELDWYVAYCGGEDTNKASEYANYINMLYNEARSKGTVNIFTSPHQSWGAYLSAANDALMAGKHIYANNLRVNEEMEQGNGLGWGKVELAVQAIAESISHGYDPAIIDAFFNWTLHNEIEFNKIKDAINTELTNQIVNLDGKRVAVDQFIFKEDDRLPTRMHFKEHSNILLRGLDPDQTSPYVNDPQNTNRPNIGYFGLAQGGYDVSLIATKLFQRTLENVNTIKRGVVFNVSLVTDNVISYKVRKDVGAVSGKHTLYVVSKERGIIHTRDVSALFNDQASVNTNFSFTYSAGQITNPLDTLFAYILDENMQGEFSWVGHCRVINQLVSNSFSLELITHGNILTPSDSSLPNDVQELEVIVKRTYNLHATTVQLRAINPETNTPISINNATVVNVPFLAGESEKRVMVQFTTPSQITNINYVNLFLGGSANLSIANLLVGVRSTGRQDYAQISLKDNSGKIVNTIDTNNTYELYVNFSKDSDYFIDDLTLNLAKIIGNTASAKLGDKYIVSNSITVYPISFSGTTDVVAAINLTDVNNAAFKTNTLNIAFGSSVINPTSPIFSPIVVGRNVVVKRLDNLYQLDFTIALRDHTEGGYVFDLNSNLVDLNLPTSVISSQGQVRFKGTIPINKLNSDVITLNFVRAGQTFPLKFNLNVDKLIPVEIEYRDGGFSNKDLETKRYFRIMVTNPFSDRSLNFTRTNFPVSLGITNITYADKLNEIIEPSLSVAVAERKQLTVGDWVSIENLESSLTDIFKYAPNCTVSQVLMSNGSVVKVGDYSTEVGEILVNSPKYKVQALNLTTGTPIMDNGMVDNFIDVITEFQETLNAFNTVRVSTNRGYTATVRNTIRSADMTVIVGLLVRRDDTNPNYDDGVNFTLEFIGNNNNVVHKVTTSVKGI